MRFISTTRLIKVFTRWNRYLDDTNPIAFSSQNGDYDCTPKQNAFSETPSVIHSDAIEKDPTDAIYDDSSRLVQNDSNVPPYLPVDILTEISLYCDDESLINLAGANSILYDISTRILYRKILPMRKSKTVRCLRTLSSRPDLALHTRKYSFSNLGENGLLLPSFFGLLSSALRNMHRLDDLILLIAGSQSYVLRGCTFKLRKLITSCDWDKDLTDWLAGQEELRTALFCGDHTPGGQLIESALPNLRRISASPMTLASVVPGRTVKAVEICLYHQLFFNEGIISTVANILSYSSGPLQSLQLVFPLAEPASSVLEALRSIPHHLPNLTSLALHTVSGPISKEVLDRLDIIIRQFKSIKALMILSESINDAVHCEGLTRELAIRWHGVCPSLNCVSFPGLTWVRNKHYGWVTLGHLERILAEREKALQEKQINLRKQQQALNVSHRLLDGIERRLETLSGIHEAKA